MRLPAAHRVTTAHLQAAYPFMSEGGLGGRGTYIGQDLFGGAFTYDPWELYSAGVLSNPNALVAGVVGKGKSALVKSYILRQQVFGRRAVVLSPKPGEYDRLAEAMGVTPISLYPGGAVRLNPLDAMIAPADATPTAVAQHRETLLVSLAEAAVRRPLEPEEVTATGLALAEANPGNNGVLTLPAVVDALLRPTRSAAESIAVDVETLAQDGRKAGLALRRMVTGDLRGMFDAPTTPGVSLGGPLTLIDLSRMYSSPALGIIMLCANAWQQAAVSRSDSSKWISVSEEAWATLRYTSVARGMQESYKLARSYGVQNIIVLHRLSDLEATGAAGSETRTLARGLLEDTETRIILNQPPGEISTAVRLLGLTDAEAALLPGLPRGRALWKIAGRSFLVDHRLSQSEWPIIDTDAGMNVGAAH
ncbi:MAG: ATP-binding protein [Nitriliruptorales bacterium]|nr:ATP-binding protein [Nitriliruptorales bacterium]